MKLKFAALLALVTWLCVVAWVGAMIVAKPAAHFAQGNDDTSMVVADLQIALTRNQNAATALAGLRRGGIDDETVRIIAEARPAKSEVGVGGSGDPAAILATSASVGTIADDIPREYTVAMIVSGDLTRTALIDGVYARTGDKLRDGARVHRIEQNAVIIDDANGRHTVKVRTPRFRRTAGARN